METRVLTVDPHDPDSGALRDAAAILRAGGLVAFPTETVYGLGANALDAGALARIYRAKRRPANDPIIAHIARSEQLRQLAADVPTLALDLADAFWPGPLTLILRRARGIPDNIAAGLGTVAVRMPAHPVARALLAAADLPVGAPSANTFTRPSATTAAHVLEDLGGRIDLVLDGGPATIGVESTVLDLTGDAPVVLRPGGVLLEELQALAPAARLAPRYSDTDSAERSPGQLLKHYSPRAEVLLFGGSDAAAVRGRMLETARRLGSERRQVGLLLADEDATIFEGLGPVFCLGSRDDLPAISRQLFAGLRSLDSHGVDAILVRDFGRTGLGEALWDRLLRAAEGRVISD